MRIETLELTWTHDTYRREFDQRHVAVCNEVVYVIRYRQFPGMYFAYADGVLLWQSTCIDTLRQRCAENAYDLLLNGLINA